MDRRFHTGTGLMRRPRRQGEASPLQEGDAPAHVAGDAAELPAVSHVPVCDWCHVKPRADGARSRFCSKRCRQTAFRIRRRREEYAKTLKPMKFAYADPPYPGFAKRLYGNEASYAGEVDHAALIASLVDRYDGWALSTGAYALRTILPLCPENARVCAWVKPIGVSCKTFGLHNTWEPLIVVAGRSRRPGKRDWFSAQPARGGGDLVGRKPLAFCSFLFDALGMLPGDSLDDLFPGTDVVSRAWEEVSRTAAAHA